MSWIESGSPRDKGPDPLLASAKKEAPPTWPLGKPDYIIDLPREQKIAATGINPYRYISVPSPNREEDLWVRAAVIHPGNRKVLHHALVFIKKEGEKGMGHLDPVRRGFLSGYVPGTTHEWVPEGTAKLLPASSTLVFQLHYTATGKEETDRTQLGLYVSREKPKAELLTRGAGDFRFLIKPGVEEHPVEAEFRFSKDSLLYEVTPHMHLRGKHFRYELHYPDGRSEVVLSVPHYDFNWQHNYRLAEPKKIPSGSRLLVKGAFDNSDSNPHNPDPSLWVKFGEQTYEEMFIGYFLYSEVPTEVSSR
jgi:hypothetical protein